jgi:hypothetical protein
MAYETNPNEPEYVIALAKLDAATGHTRQAEIWISRLRAMGRFHLLDSEARELESRLRSAQRVPNVD